MRVSAASACVCSGCLPRHVAIAIDLSDIAACAKGCSSVGAQKQVTQKDRLVAGFIVEDMLSLSTIESPCISVLIVWDKVTFLYFSLTT